MRAMAGEAGGSCSRFASQCLGTLSSRIQECMIALGSAAECVLQALTRKVQHSLKQPEGCAVTRHPSRGAISM